jgi:hypothetical protein
MPSNGARRSFAVRAWIALASALFLVSSAVAAADAPGTTIATAPAAAQVTSATPNAAALAAEARFAGDDLADRGLDAQREARQAAASLESGRAQAAAATAAPTAGRPATPSAPRVYAGKNRFWYPALGISQAVGWFACDSPNAPGPLVYRWGCAGANNVYLLAHAGGKFQPIYNAYYAHRLKVGQLAVYADSQGREHYFKLAWYKVTPPLASSHWAWDPQPVSSLTLQTCLGANSELRLFVRFVEVPRP